MPSRVSSIAHFWVNRLQEMTRRAELVALVQEHCFYHLEAPIERVTGWDTPYPHAYEWDYFPSPYRVSQAIKQVMEE